jgi:hypothetical protein
MLDIDSTEIPVYGNEEQSVHNGHFESTWYHPLLLFNCEGDFLAAKLRLGNVHSADDWGDRAASAMNATPMQMYHQASSRTEPSSPEAHALTVTAGSFRSKCRACISGHLRPPRRVYGCPGSI